MSPLIGLVNSRCMGPSLSLSMISMIKRLNHTPNLPLDSDEERCSASQNEFCEQVHDVDMSEIILLDLASWGPGACVSRKLSGIDFSNVK